MFSCQVLYHPSVAFIFIYPSTYLYTVHYITQYLLTFTVFINKTQVQRGNLSGNLATYLSGNLATYLSGNLV